MKKHAFGHVLVEEAICVGHFLEALGEILAVHLLGYEWGSAIFCRSVLGTILASKLNNWSGRAECAGLA